MDPGIIRDGETTRKINVSFVELVGIGGREENRPKRFFFGGGGGETPQQDNFGSANFIVEKFCCHCAGS